MTDFAKRGFVSRLRVSARADFHARAPYALSRGRPEPRLAARLRRPIGNSDVNAAREYPPVVHRLRLSPSP